VGVRVRRREGREGGGQCVQEGEGEGRGRGGRRRRERGREREGLIGTHLWAAS